MFCTDIRQLDQCIFFPYDAARVVGIAKDQHFALLVYYGFQLFEIHLIGAVHQFERVVDHFPFHAFRNNPERMVYRWLDNYFVARFGKALDDKADAFDNSRNIAEPFPFDLPVLFIMYPFYNTIIIRV